LFGQEDWDLRRNQDGIIVYTRKKVNADALEFKALTSVNASVSTLVKVLKDVESYHLWMKDLKTAKRIKTVSENEWYAWYGAEVPWPLEDRDVIYQLKLSRYKDKTVITLESKPDYIPEKGDYVRMNTAEGKWVFSPMSDTETQVLYQFFADPEIKVPLWIMNMFIVDGPFETLKDLKKIAKEDRYK
jgi:hypothetical protein